MKLTRRDGGVRAMWQAEIPAGAIALAWLGQAGFAIRSSTRRVLIDPYLSDYLAAKYKDAEFPHVRMMPPPIAPDELTGIDLVLCSHRHSDHMDPLTLPDLAATNPRCQFVIPRAEWAAAIVAGIAEHRLIPANAGDSLSWTGIAIDVLAAAHEEIKTNARGEHHFLGFVLRWTEMSIYHSGDCVVYDGLADKLKIAGIDLALLPVNGRDEYRTSRGIIGNMNFDEAVDLCRAAHIPAMIAHHFGMFDFNTVDVAQLKQRAAEVGDIRIVVPDTGSHLLASA